MKLDLEQFIFALSDTIDLVGVDEIQHGKRVACMAWKCSEILGYDATRQRHLFHLGLLHDCGVSSTEERSHLVKELEWDSAHVHCQTGSVRMEYFPPLQPLAQPILHHHTRWEKLRDSDVDPSSRIDGNLIYLLDRVDYLCQISPSHNWLGKKNHVRHKINTFKGSYFATELVEAFLEASASEAFWFSLEPMMLPDFINSQKKNRQNILITTAELKKIAKLFALIVDAKSVYTAEHSTGVASLSRLLAELSGLDEETGQKVEVAGLLHDLGKMQVPDRVLENQGALTDEDLSHMRHHSYATYRILQNIEGMEEIATWAGNHHEALDGSGYPFRKTSNELDLESRIITIADIFQALAQKRPYRHASPLPHILEFLKSNSDKGRLDRDVVATVMENSDICYEHAINL